jgi:DNA modification methylase
MSKCTNEGELVVDPFGGSGTTILAAQETGRRCITIELELEYAKIAEQRLAQEVLGL